MGRKLKTYSAELGTVRDERLRDFLRELNDSRSQVRFGSFIVAATKAEAIAALETQGWLYIHDRDLRVVHEGRTDMRALTRARLLDEPGVLLVHKTADGSGCPVVRPDEDGAPAMLGRLRFQPDVAEYDFFPVRAKYCAEGSVAAGYDTAWIKDGGRWYPAAGFGSETDHWIDGQIECGKLEILRAGRGRFEKE